jgi:hypothetical protein
MDLPFSSKILPRRNTSLLPAYGGAMCFSFNHERSGKKWSLSMLTQLHGLYHIGIAENKKLSAIGISTA